MTGPAPACRPPRVRRCVYALHLCLEAMAAELRRRAPDGPAVQAALHGADYALRILCPPDGRGRVLVVMDEPYARRFVVGRFAPDGELRRCPQGAELFAAFLDNEGLVEVVSADLEESLALTVLGAGARQRHLS